MYPWGMGTGVGVGGVIPGTQPHCSRERSRTAKRARRPCRAGVVVLELGTPGLAGPPTPCGRGPLRCPATPPRANAASWPIKARFHDIYCKVSQKCIVSPKYHEKACHSPYLQNGLGKSPLEILRFLFWPAFSHKELMGLF